MVAFSGANINSGSLNGEWLNMDPRDACASKDYFVHSSKPQV